MYLRSLEIAGFKSFGTRTRLELSPGIVGIVGPNGAGKSNLSDALRWVLGAQSAKLLRTKKSEEVIFGGGEKKARASLAEVTIVLDNSDHAMPIEFSQVQITRRLYRSGESEYLLGGRKVRLLDVAEILAQSGFGQNSYSFIAQGTIDSLLLATPSERKLMFDEASGIRTFELRRDQTNKKLAQAKENLAQTDRLIDGLIPQRDSLKAKSETISRKTELENKLTDLRQAYLDFQTAQLSIQRQNRTDELEKKQAELTELRQNLHSLHQTQKQRDSEQQKRTGQLTKLRDQLNRAEAKRDTEYEDLARATAELELLKSQAQSEIESAAADKTDAQKIAILEKKLTTIEKQYAALEQKNRGYEEKIAVFDDKLRELNDDLAVLRRRLNKNQKSDYVLHALGLISMLRRELKRQQLERQTFTLLLHKLSRVIKLASEENPAELLSSINKQQKLITREMSRREEILEVQTAEIIKMRALELDTSYLEKELAALRRAQTDHTQQSASEDLKNQLQKKQTKVAKLSAKVEAADEQVETLRSQLLAPTELADTATDKEFVASVETISRQQAAASEQLKHLESELAELAGRQTELTKLGRLWRLQTKPNSNLSSASLGDIHRLEGELALLQEVDPASPGEYKQISQKLDFLQSQHADLVKAVEDMEKIQRNLDKLIMEKFEHSFAKINKKFSHYFEQLFDGGRAELKLQKNPEGEYGIEIIACPPGKKVELLSSLSGGEKALASTALLAAILTVNPSPFVVLDEVDAALDDLNSIKFNKILKELSHRSQLIIITHNHQTMQQANELVGVAPQPGGDSKLLHVRLQKARQLAET